MRLGRCNHVVTLILGFFRLAVSAITVTSDFHMNRNQAGYLKNRNAVLGSTMTCKWR